MDQHLRLLPILQGVTKLGEERAVFDLAVPVDVLGEAHGVEEFERYHALGRFTQHIAYDVDGRLDRDEAGVRITQTGRVWRGVTLCPGSDIHVT